MPLSNKQKHSLDVDRPISPPPLRRKTEHSYASPSSTPIQSLDIHTASATDLNPKHLRIFSWNVNGITPLLQPPISAFFASSTASSIPPEPPLRAFLRRHKYPQILCLQEVKIAPSDAITQRTAERATNFAISNIADSARTTASQTAHDSVSCSYTAHFSLPRDPYNARAFGSKIYGVCTLIRNDFAIAHSATTQTIDWDLEGRVLLTELKIQGQKLLVVNGYWVNGTSSPYYEPGRAKHTKVINGTRHDWKRRFHTLMLDTCRDYEQRGWKVLLIGDMNISRGPLDGFPGIRLGEEHVRNRADFEKKFLSKTEEDGLKGIDVWRHLKGDERKYTYFPRGVAWESSCDRVDLCVASRGLVAINGGIEKERNANLTGLEIVGMGILDNAQERGPSDHVPLFVTLDYKGNS